ncbi:ABC transporter permease [Georgenia deserti]|uniref:ABC transporter permease n=1 Tax=Georgenia deserti TaxID=2093781 RepID=A0ABW4L2A7_9MICO
MTTTEEIPTTDSAPKAATGTATASKSALVWRGFRKHRLAMVGLIVSVFIYLVAAFAEFLAPFDTADHDADHTYAPPQRLHILDTSEGRVDLGLYVYGYETSLDPETLETTYEVDRSEKIDVRFFDDGPEYELWGLIPSNLHLIGPVDDDQPMYLWGADENGRDVLSRTIAGTRVSMSIGLVGVALAFLLGITLGGVSGYLGGRVDTVLQRVVEFFMSLPVLPLWLGLAAALPQSWGPLQRYFAITVILAGIAWTDLARVTRGRFLSLREEQFVTAAIIDGNSRPRLIFRHMLPSFTSHLIASLTLSIPGMILAETALSFLGLGLQAPVVSWGVLLQDAQNIRVVSSAPWLLLPGGVVVLAILALNFVGDGLRDAADPYRR